MRPLKLLIASIALVAGALVWFWSRVPDPRVAAGPAVERATDAAPSEEAQVARSTSERASLAPTALTDDSQPANPRELVAPPEFSYWGKVVSADSGTPIAGARFRWLGIATDAALETDANGLFHVAEAPQRRGIARIDAHGFGPRLAQAVRGHATVESAEVFRLQRAAALNVLVLDAREHPMAGVRVSVSAAAMSLGRLEGAYISRPREFLWSADTSGGGTCSIEGIAPDVPLTLVVQRERKELYEERARLTLEPGQRRAWVCRLDGVRLFGTVRDQDESPVARHELWLMSDALYGESQSARRYFDTSEQYSIAQKCTTDDSGAFAFDNVPRGAWWIGPAPTRHEAGAPPSPVAATPVATSVLVDEGTAAAMIELRAHRGLYVQGRVIRPDGSAAADAQVCARSDDPEGALCVETWDDGTFVLGPFAPGELRVSAFGTDGFAAAAPVAARAGDESVVLTVSPAASMRVQAVDAQSGERCHALFRTRARDAAVRGSDRMTRTIGAEPADLEGLAEGVYDVSAHTDDGRVGVARGVAIVGGAEPAEISVQVGPGATLRVRLEGRAQTLAFEVVNDGAVVFSERIANDESRFAVVPPGASTVRLASGDRVLEERTVTALADEEVGVIFHRH